MGRKDIHQLQNGSYTKTGQKIRPGKDTKEASKGYINLFLKENMI